MKTNLRVRHTVVALHEFYPIKLDIFVICLLFIHTPTKRYFLFGKYSNKTLKFIFVQLG